MIQRRLAKRAGVKSANGRPFLEVPPPNFLRFLDRDLHMEI